MAKVDVQEASEDTTAVTESAETEVQTSAPTEQSVTTQQGKKLNITAPNMTKRAVLDVVLLLVIVGLAVWGWLLYNDKQDLTNKVTSLNKQLSEVRANPQIAVEQQTKDLLNKVGALIDLPKDETPTIAEVSDAAKAKKQSAFFANAQNGDKVLMYVKAGQAILYRPSTNKIIIVAPLTFSGSNSAKQ